MKVYLCKACYTTGGEYESESSEYILKVVDSEEKAKQLAYDRAIENAKNQLENANKWLDKSLRFDEDGPYYDIYGDEQEKESLMQFLCEKDVYQRQLDAIVKGQKSYSIQDVDGYEIWSFGYETWEVE